MASIPNLPANVLANVLANNEKKPEPEIVTTTNTLQRTDSSAMNPPGAWVTGCDDDKNTGESHVAAVGEAVVGALGAAGSTAAKYLPTSFMNTYNTYAREFGNPLRRLYAEYDVSATSMMTSNPNVINSSARESRPPSTHIFKLTTKSQPRARRRPRTP